MTFDEVSVINRIYLLVAIHFRFRSHFWPLDNLMYIEIPYMVRVLETIGKVP